MTKWKILLTDGLEENGQELLRAVADVDSNPTITADDLLKVVGDYDALIVRGRTKVTPAVFEAGNKLRVVGRSGVGVDNIDLAAAKAKGVTVVNAPIATTLAVAELTLGLMLSLMREIPRGDAGMKSANWLKKELVGGELYQKTLGIIGCGRIGSAVGDRARAFGMHVIGFDSLLSEMNIRQKGIEPASLESVFQRSDIITMHVPLNDQTRNMVNGETIKKMKKGVYLVCSARGSIIDEGALLSALDSGQVAGAGLDVYSTEPPGDSVLAAHSKVIATPHIGAQTREAQERSAGDIASEVLAALNNAPLRWRVA
ncbi:MAG: hydroxyacid dehydrogenase [Anaerolineaceae bacterium]|nr:hydroxyacid dehydrogenase [Anaerolineaceae bacterium]MBN2676823.1 hydroxyacid dehydrogenase [Anaerolineaceae bacterium]